jgi:hypothetical protein
LNGLPEWQSAVILPGRRQYFLDTDRKGHLSLAAIDAAEKGARRPL